MNDTEKKRFISINAAILAVGILASFVLPLISDSITQGRSAFLRMILHVAPLIGSMMASTAVFNRALDKSTEDEAVE